MYYIKSVSIKQGKLIQLDSKKCCSSIRSDRFVVHCFLIFCSTEWCMFKVIWDDFYWLQFQEINWTSLCIYTKLGPSYVFVCCCAFVPGPHEYLDLRVFFSIKILILSDCTRTVLPYIIRCWSSLSDTNVYDRPTKLKHLLNLKLIQKFNCNWNTSFTF